MHSQVTSLVHYRYIRRNFALDGQKVVGPRGGIGRFFFVSHPLDLKPRILLLNSANMQTWHNTERTRSTAINSGKGEGLVEGSKGKGVRVLPFELFFKQKFSSCILGTFGIASHKIMFMCFVHGDQALPK